MGKTVTFRDNCKEKSPSPRRFVEPEGMTDVDLRRLSELSSISDSSIRKFNIKSVKRTLIKLLALFVLLAFAALVLIIIFRQARPLYNAERNAFNTQSESYKNTVNPKPSQILDYVAEKVAKCKADKTLESCCTFIDSESVGIVIEDCSVSKMLKAIERTEAMNWATTTDDVADKFKDFLKKFEGQEFDYSSDYYDDGDILNLPKIFTDAQAEPADIMHYINKEISDFEKSVTNLYSKNPFETLKNVKGLNEQVDKAKNPWILLLINENKDRAKTTPSNLETTEENVSSYDEESLESGSVLSSESESPESALSSQAGIVKNHESKPWMIKSTVENMAIPKITNATDVKLNLNDTNVNITYTDAIGVKKRQVHPPNDQVQHGSNAFLNQHGNLMENNHARFFENHGMHIQGPPLNTNFNRNRMSLQNRQFVVERPMNGHHPQNQPPSPHLTDMVRMDRERASSNNFQMHPVPLQPFQNTINHGQRPNEIVQEQNFLLTSQLEQPPGIPSKLTPHNIQPESTRRVAPNNANHPIVTQNVMSEILEPTPLNINVEFIGGASNPTTVSKEITSTAESVQNVLASREPSYLHDAQLQSRVSNHNKKMSQFSQQDEQPTTSNQNLPNICYNGQLGASLPLLQQQVPFSYNVSPKMAQLWPINVQRPQTSSYVINPQYTYVTATIPQAVPQQLSSFGGIYPSNSQPILQANAAGQYYLCNPIQNGAGSGSSNGQVAGIPGVEVRISEPRLGAAREVSDYEEDVVTPRALNTTRSSPDCPDGYQQCGSNEMCIKSAHICDNEVHCEDGSDEAYCPCRSRIGYDRICDGYYDCPNGEDEVSCYGCDEYSFNCGDWSYNHGATCVDMNLRCDGIEDCPSGSDERDCSALLDDVQTSKDPHKISNSAGFLHRNFRGRWFPACLNPEVWALEACKDEIAPSVIPPVTQSVPIDHDYKGAFINSDPSDGFKIDNHCVYKRAVYVECPQPTCGTRKYYRESYRRDEGNDSDEEIISKFRLMKQRKDDMEHKRVKRKFRKLKRGRRQTFPNLFKTDIYRYFDAMKNQVVNNSTKNNITTTTEEPSAFNESVKDSIVGNGRVVGGRACQAGAWPWVASIYKNGAFHCGAVLISDAWLATAAHCVERYWQYYYEVEMGMLRRFSYSPMQQTRYISHVIPHPSYDRKNLKNDLALVRLHKPVKFNKYVRPVCLPSEYTAGQYYDKGPRAGTVCTAVGWGATVEHGPDPDHMREVEVPVLPYCKHKVDEEGHEICAGLNEGGKDACQGDSGGPFLCRNPNIPDQWYLAGIVSHGEGCARPNEPGVYTRVAMYLPWIYDNAKDEMLPDRQPLYECPGYTCKGINRCIPKKRRCDQMVDCLHGDDEFECDRRSSFASLFQHAVENIISRSKSSEDPAVPAAAINGNDTSAMIGSDKADDTSFASPTPVSDPGESISIAGAASNGRSAGDKEGEETVAKTTVNGTVMMAPFKGRRFLCSKMLQVIPAERRCDRRQDCEDGTDEAGCRCADYLRFSHPDAICDGVTDCADLSDEEGCASCGADEFHCRLSGSCVPMRKKCDNRADCARNEDEWDCFALADGYSIRMDAESRPALSASGVLAYNAGGDWWPVCLNFTGTEGQTAAGVCSALGFSDYEKYMHLQINNGSLLVIKDKEERNEKGGYAESNHTCSALYVRCSDISVSTNEDLSSIASPPWSAYIFADAKYKCTGSILNLKWILTSARCFPGILELHKQYVAVLLGATRVYSNVGGPHEQIIPVVESVHVPEADTVLLRLSHDLKYTRYVRPLHFQRKSHPGRSKETCVTTDVDLQGIPRVVPLRPVHNCSSGFRCFKEINEINEVPGGCMVSHGRTWSGCVMCDSGSGFYPAATFSEPERPCAFTKTIALHSITDIKHRIFELIAKKTNVTSDPQQCNGFRCTLGDCIPPSKLCNGIPDCRDSSDENVALCTEMNVTCHLTSRCACKTDEVKCNNGNCNSKTLFCDQNNDCGDYSDEPDRCNCRSYLKLTNPHKICNGITDCLDKSDEDPLLCECKSTKFHCKRSEACVPNDMVCDGQKDCPDNEDEEDCLSLLTTNEKSGEVLTRTSGIWHPGCFPEKLTTTPLEEICSKLGFLGGSAMQLNATEAKAKRPVPQPFWSVWVHRGSNTKSQIRLSMRLESEEHVKFVDDPSCNRLFLECL